jgi:hypothetical protein
MYEDEDLMFSLLTRHLTPTAEELWFADDISRVIFLAK